MQNLKFEKAIKSLFIMLISLNLIITISNKAFASPSNWANQTVNEAIAVNLVPLELQKNYQKMITREAFCKLALKMFEAYSSSDIDVLLANNNVSVNEKPFTDTNSKYILAAYKFGIVNGMPDGTFKPNKNITREEAAKILTVLTDIFGKLEEKKLIDFEDKTSIGKWAQEYVDYVVLTEIMNGVKDGEKVYFMPKSNYTIEQAIVTIKRLYDKIIDFDKDLIGDIETFITNMLEGMTNSLKLYSYNYDASRTHLNYVDVTVTENEYEFKIKIGNAEINIIGKYDTLAAIELDGNALENELYLKYYDTNGKEYIKILKYQGEHFDTLLTLVNIEYFGEVIKADGNGKIFGVFQTFSDGTINGYYDINRDYAFERVINKNINGKTLIKKDMTGAKVIHQNRETRLTKELVESLKLEVGNEVIVRDIYLDRKYVTIITSNGVEIRVTVEK